MVALVAWYANLESLAANPRMLHTIQEAMRQRFEAQRSAFETEPFASLAVRKSRLTRPLELTEAHEAEICAAIDADFGGRSQHETLLAELLVVRAGIRHARRHLRSWMHERTVPTALHFRPARNRLLPQPLGVVGVVSPWNYPFQLALAPVMAAGNRVLVKPSELTRNSRVCSPSSLRRISIRRSWASSKATLKSAKAFVSLPFDHLLFTDSPAVGRQVALAAAQNLTPVTLELGGKSPAVFDRSCDLDAAVNSVAYGKLLNAGQSCIAPDYLMVPKDQGGLVAEKMAAAIRRLYPTIQDNPDYTAIVSDRHFDRLRGLVSEARAGGAEIIEVKPADEQFDGNGGKFPPTLIRNADPASRLMREEIFGPVLPIREYAYIEDAIGYINQGERPLAFYWFGRNRANRKRVLTEVVAGGVTINDCLLHLAQEDQPFGGVGASGMGAYHGEWGFRTFSKEKPVFLQSRFNSGPMIRPPYGAKTAWAARLFRWLS